MNFFSSFFTSMIRFSILPFSLNLSKRDVMDDTFFFFFFYSTVKLIISVENIHVVDFLLPQPSDDELPNGTCKGHFSELLNNFHYKLIYLMLKLSYHSQQKLQSLDRKHYVLC